VSDDVGDPARVDEISTWFERVAGLMQQRVSTGELLRAAEELERLLLDGGSE
jgi:hypothetical protein